MKKTTIALLIILLTSMMAVGFAPKAASQGSNQGLPSVNDNVKVIDYSFYLDSLGSLNLVGQVQNQGPNTVNPVFLSGAIYDSDGVEQGYTSTQVFVHYLLPQQKAPFMLQFGQPQNQQYWGDLSQIGKTDFIVYANDTSQYIYPDLKITSKTASIGTGNYSGGYQIDGVIKNTGTQTATGLSVSGTFFNSAGKVVALSMPYYLGESSPYSLAPGQTMKFQAWALDQNQTEMPADKKIASYELLVQADGPLLEGQPIVSTDPNSQGTSDPNNPTNPANTNNPSNNSSPINTTTIAIIAAVAAVIVVGTVLAVKFLKPKPKLTTKEKRKLKKAGE